MPTAEGNVIRKTSFKLLANVSLNASVIPSVAKRESAGNVTVAIPHDLLRLWQNVYAAEILAEKAVHECGFSRIHLAAEHEKKGRSQPSFDFRERQLIAEIRADFSSQRGNALHHAGQSFARREVALAEHPLN